MDILGNISDAMGMPAEVVKGALRTVIFGTEQIYIENYTALLEYKRENIKLKFRTGIIEISGSDFEIRAVSEGNIVIIGKINAVRFI